MHAALRLVAVILFRLGSISARCVTDFRLLYAYRLQKEHVGMRAVIPRSKYRFQRSSASADHRIHLLNPVSWTSQSKSSILGVLHPLIDASKRPVAK